MIIHERDIVPDMVDDIVDVARCADAEDVSGYIDDKCAILPDAIGQRVRAEALRQCSLNSCIACAAHHGRCLMQS